MTAFGAASDKNFIKMMLFILVSMLLTPLSLDTGGRDHAIIEEHFNP